jgi:hypothetical protein
MRPVGVASCFASPKKNRIADAAMHPKSQPLAARKSELPDMACIIARPATTSKAGSGQKSWSIAALPGGCVCSGRSGP